MRITISLFAAVFTALLAADPASAFTTTGMPARIQSQMATSSPMKASFNEFLDGFPKPKQKKMTRARKQEIIKSKMVASALVSAAIFLGSAFTGMAALTVSPEPAFANDSKTVGQLKGSGLVFKDTLNIERFEDPKVQGVVLYISNFERPVTEKLSKGNFFNDPSYASVACARTGQKVAIASNINKTPQGEEVFEESRSLLFKTLRVQRVYDEEKK